MKEILDSLGIAAADLAMKDRRVKELEEENKRLRESLKDLSASLRVANLHEFAAKVDSIRFHGTGLSDENTLESSTGINVNKNQERRGL